MDEGEIITLFFELVEQLRLEIELLTAKTSEIEPHKAKILELEAKLGPI
jgi:hypothetical protein